MAETIEMQVWPELRHWRACALDVVYLVSGLLHSIVAVDLHNDLDFSVRTSIVPQLR
jgi:hypothetical protein